MSDSFILILFASLIGLAITLLILYCLIKAAVTAALKEGVRVVTELVRRQLRIMVKQLQEKGHSKEEIMDIVTKDI